MRSVEGTISIYFDTRVRDALEVVFIEFVH